MPGEPPDVYVRRLAELKAACAAATLDQRELQIAVVAAADTTVAHPVDGPEGPSFEILGKPADALDAADMLRRLRGHRHPVYSGIAVLVPTSGWMRSEVVLTDVHMRAYTDKEIAEYIAGGDPLDKAGAYGIQHRDFQPVQKLQGCYPNVMGLPVCRLRRLLIAAGLPPGADVFQACELDEMRRPCEVFRAATRS
jgi:MAF protein